LAAYNWLKHTGEMGDSGECVALIDLGATTTDIVIERENQFRFPRSLNVGGNDITQAVASAVGCTFAEAEKMKRERAFAPTGDAQRDGKMGEVLGPVLNRLVSEITRSFAYFRSQPGGGAVQKVILTGGGACLRNIVPFLQRQLGVEVRIAQPLAGLAIVPTAQEASEHPEQAAVVLGLALRTVETVAIQVNLIPPRILGMARRKEQAFYWVLSLATLALILASIIPVQAAKDEDVQKQIRQLETVLGSYDPKLLDSPQQESEWVGTLMGVQTEVKKYQDQLEFLRTKRDHSYFWTDYLNAVTEARPSSAFMVFSQIETTIIGGAENTGQAWRNRVAGIAAPAPTTPVAPTPSFNFGGADDDDEDDRFSLRFGNLGGLGLPGAQAPGGAAQQQGYTSEGFPGISGGGGGGMRMSGGGGLGIGGGGMFSGPVGQAAQPQAREIPEPNGLSIQGYTTSPEAFKEFADNLKASPMFQEVYYSEADLQEVAEYEMANVPVSGGMGAMPRGGQDLDDRDRERDRGGFGGGFGGLGGMGMGMGMGRAPGLGGGQAIPPGVPKVLRFRLDAQFQGDIVEQPTTSIAAGARGTMGGGGGMFGYDDDDEDDRGRWR
jgi:hypothetical protein